MYTDFNKTSVIVLELLVAGWTPVLFFTPRILEGFLHLEF